MDFFWSKCVVICIASHGGFTVKRGTGRLAVRECPYAKHTPLCLEYTPFLRWRQKQPYSGITSAIRMGMWYRFCLTLPRTQAPSRLRHHVAAITGNLAIRTWQILETFMSATYPVKLRTYSFFDSEDVTSANIQLKTSALKMKTLN